MTEWVDKDSKYSRGKAIPINPRYFGSAKEENRWFELKWYHYFHTQKNY